MDVVELPKFQDLPKEIKEQEIFPNITELLNTDVKKELRFLIKKQNERWKKIDELHEDFKKIKDLKKQEKHNLKIISALKKTLKEEKTLFKKSKNKFSKYIDIIIVKPNNDELTQQETNRIKRYSSVLKDIQKSIKFAEEYLEKRLNLQELLKKGDISGINKLQNIKLESQLGNLSKKLDNLNEKIVNVQRERKINRPTEKIIEKEIKETNIDVDNIDKLLKAIKENRSAGTVATLSGFLGITTASIIARIIGNSTASYLAPRHKQNINIINKQDDKDNLRNKLIELLESRRSDDLNNIKNDIEHLEERAKEEDKIKKKKKHYKIPSGTERTRFAGKKIYHRRNNDRINLINIVNKI
jgi:hypothetical protein